MTATDNLEDTASASSMVETFRRRSGARLAFMASSVQEVCNAWGECGPGDPEPIMKPYRFRRVMQSDNPTIVDIVTVSKILGVNPRVLLHESADVSEIESAETPRHLVSYRSKPKEDSDG